jgi:hypothetical protein
VEDGGQSGSTKQPPAASRKIETVILMKKSIAVALLSLNFAWFGPGAPAQEAAAPAAADIAAKVAAKYAGLTSLAVTGRVITDIDMSGGKDPATAPKTDELKYDLGQPGKVTTFSIRLAKPDLYRVEWSQMMSESYTQKGAAWSSGKGDFLLLAGKQRTIEGGMSMALASATGVSGGVAATLPAVFFQLKTNQLPNQLQGLTNLVLLPEEKIGDDSCFVLSGEMSGQKLIFWITKDYLVKQKKMVLGGETKMKIPEISDEDLKKTLSQIGEAATPEAIASMRTTMKTMQAASSKIKGSITEKYETFQANPVLTKESFENASDATGKTGN